MGEGAIKVTGSSLRGSFPHPPAPSRKGRGRYLVSTFIEATISDPGTRQGCPYKAPLFPRNSSLSLKTASSFAFASMSTVSSRSSQHCGRSAGSM